MKKFYLLSILLTVTVMAFSQERSRNTPGQDPAVKIVKFYPNPATSVINFDFQKNADKTYNFQIFSLTGKKVFEASKVEQKTIVNLGDFYRGIYIFQLKDQYGKLVESGKFQVSK
ncbi:MAG: T9SS type A sorting domain-containing protein [Flavitalea sp.]